MDKGKGKISAEVVDESERVTGCVWWVNEAPSHTQSMSELPIIKRRMFFMLNGKIRGVGWTTVNSSVRLNGS